MKKTLILMMVLAVASVASAGVITIQVESSDSKPGGYDPGETITIELVTSGFGTTPFSTELGQMIIGTITDTGGGSAVAVGTLHAYFDQIFMHGDLVNSGGILIEDITGACLFFDGAGDQVPNGEVAYTFEFTTGAIIGTGYTMDVTGLVTRNAAASPVASTVTSLGYDVIPEPMTIALLGLGSLFLLRRRK